jgi:uncharacterized protein
MLNLGSVGMRKGMLYETVVTTKNRDGSPNAAPIGVTCTGQGEVALHLHQGSRTVQNVKAEGRFVVNILKDPVLFVESTLGNLSQNSFDKYNQDFHVKNADAFFIAEVTHIKDVEKEDQFGVSTATVLKAEVRDLVKKSDCVEPINRAIYGIIEALVYLTRMDMVSGDMEKLYRHRMSEISRIVNKVGGAEHKKAMKKISEAFSRYDDKSE